MPRNSMTVSELIFTVCRSDWVRGRRSKQRAQFSHIPDPVPPEGIDEPLNSENVQLLRSGQLRAGSLKN